MVLGLLSYGIYIWHNPIVKQLGKRDVLISQTPEAFPLNAILLIILSIIVAAISYALIERPALKMRYRLDREGRKREDTKT